jgi:hypothetical protein
MVLADLEVLNTDVPLSGSSCRDQLDACRDNKLSFLAFVKVDEMRDAMERGRVHHSEGIKNLRALLKEFRFFIVDRFETTMIGDDIEHDFQHVTLCVGVKELEFELRESDGGNG